MFKHSTLPSRPLDLSVHIESSVKLIKLMCSACHRRSMIHHSMHRTRLATSSKLVHMDVPIVKRDRMIDSRNHHSIGLADHSPLRCCDIIQPFIRSWSATG